MTEQRCECAAVAHNHEHGACGATPAVEYCDDGWPESLILCGDCIPKTGHLHAEIARLRSDESQRRKRAATDAGAARQELMDLRRIVAAQRLELHRLGRRYREEVATLNQALDLLSVVVGGETDGGWREKVLKWFGSNGWFGLGDDVREGSDVKTEDDEK